MQTRETYTYTYQDGDQQKTMELFVVRCPHCGQECNQDSGFRKNLIEDITDSLERFQAGRSHHQLTPEENNLCNMLREARAYIRGYR